MLYVQGTKSSLASALPAFVPVTCIRISFMYSVPYGYEDKVLEISLFHHCLKNQITITVFHFHGYSDPLINLN